MAIGDVWEINQEWTDGDENGLFRAHYKEEDGGEADLEAAGLKISAYFHTAWTDAIKVEVSEDATSVCTTAQRLTAPGSRVFTFFGSGVVGLKTGVPIASGLAALFSKYTNVNSASTRGRMFAPFIAASSFIAGVVTDAAKIALTVMADAVLFDAAEVDDVGSMCGVVWSDKLKTSEDITNVILKPAAGSQRRRTNHHVPFSA
jgi:hypothetical protein